MSIQESLNEMNRLIADRRILEAFDKYYAEGVVMREAGAEPTVGKETNRERERAFVEGLRAWNAQLIASAVDERSGTSYCEWRLAFDHEAYGSADIHQVAAQKWADGRIVSESFFKL